MDILIKKENLLPMCQEILMSKGVPKKDANIVSDALTEANLRGQDSHGVIRLSKWVTGIEVGAINPLCRVKKIKETCGTTLLDGDRGLGPVVGVEASNIALCKAKEIGICLVSIRRASHLGMLAYYTEFMAKEGMIGICMTNTEAGIAPHGGVEKILGTNPLSIAVPARSDPMVLDMATSVVARGKIVLAVEEGREIPEEWAIDKDGKMTRNPKKALEGALLPCAGAKGSGLAIMVDILTGALAGASVGKNVKGTFDMKHRGTKGDLFIAIDPSTLTDFEAFLDNVENLKYQVKQAKRRKGVEEIFLPGEIEYLTKEKRLKEGIPLGEKLFEELDKLRQEGL